MPVTAKKFAKKVLSKRKYKHSKRVAKTFKKGSKERTLAYLHDVFEQNHLVEHINGFLVVDELKTSLSLELLEALECISKGENELYSNYMKRVVTSPEATLVKMADLLDKSPMNNKHKKAFQRLIRSQV